MDISSGPQEFFNPLKEEWSVNDFHSKELSLCRKHKSIELLVRHRLVPEAPGDVPPSRKPKISQDVDHLREVTRALEEVGEKYLEKLDPESPHWLASVSQRNRVGDYNKILDTLQHLAKNLQTHNEIVSEYNAQLYLGRLSPFALSDHHQLLNKIEKARACLIRGKEEYGSRLFSQVEHALSDYLSGQNRQLSIIETLVQYPEVARARKELGEDYFKRLIFSTLEELTDKQLKIVWPRIHEEGDRAKILDTLDYLAHNLSLTSRPTGQDSPILEKVKQTKQCVDHANELLSLGESLLSDYASARANELSIIETLIQYPEMATARDALGETEFKQLIFYTLEKIAEKSLNTLNLNSPRWLNRLVQKSNEDNYKRILKTLDYLSHNLLSTGQDSPVLEKVKQTKVDLDDAAERYKLRLFAQAEYVLGDRDKYLLMSEDMAHYPEVAQAKRELGDDFQFFILLSSLGPVRTEVERGRYTSPEMIETLIAYGFDASTVRDSMSRFKEIGKQAAKEILADPTIKNEETACQRMRAQLATDFAKALLIGSKLGTDASTVTAVKDLIVELVELQTLMESETARLFQQHRASIAAQIASDNSRQWAAMHPLFALYLTHAKHYGQLESVQECWRAARPRAGEAASILTGKAIENVMTAALRISMHLTPESFRTDKAWPKLWRDFLQHYQQSLPGYFHEHQRFPFAQDSWGEDAILTRGICKAITYRIEKLQIQNPDKPITCAKDLEISGSAITSEDRFIHAAYHLEVESPKIMKQLKHKKHAAEGRIEESEESPSPRTSYDIPDSLLRKDGLQGAKRWSAPSFLLLMGDLWLVQLNNSSGVLSIDLHGEKGEGHALGMRIDATRNIYSFWDPNHGYYTFSTKEELLFAIREFCTLHYPHLTKLYQAFQYIPVPPQT